MKEILRNKDILNMEVKVMDVYFYVFVAWNRLEKTGNLEITDTLLSSYVYTVMQLHTPEEIKEIATRIAEEKYGKNNDVAKIMNVGLLDSGNEGEG